MLRITPSGSAAAAKSYFRDALTKGDYYLAKDGERVRDQEIVGRWSGKAAERLGLSGTVDREAFERLCDNLHPTQDDRLTPKTKTDRRVGYDLTFSVPKSVSVLAELCGDDELRRSIVGAFRAAVAETLAEMERDVRTRVRMGGADHTRLTGGWAVAEFVHFTGRPVDGHPDPHLHLHAIAFNATYDDVEKKWKAFDIGDLKRDAPYHQAACDARLADKLIELGFKIERGARAPGADATLGHTPGQVGWEVVGVPESVVRGFSRRTEQIEALARDLGVTDPDAKAKLGATSRDDKASAFTMEELREKWWDRLDPSEADAIANVVAAARFPNLNPGAAVNRRDDLDRSLAFAVGHAFERSSVLSEKRLLALALEHGIGKVTPDEVKRRLDEMVESKEMLRGVVEEETLVTTPAVLREEREMLGTVVSGRGQYDPLHADYTIGDPALSQEQREAVTHVLSSPDSVMLIAGRAGVGKTRTMREVVQAIESTGKRVLVAAPTGMATHEVLRADGFTNATTVAHVLTNRDAKQRLKGGVLWVDEAGLLSVPNLARLVRLVKECDARLLLTGDTRQHHSVTRGDAMRLLETHAGLPVAELKEIRRQQTPQYREAAAALSKGDLVNGFKSLDAMGAIREAGRNERPTLIAEEYLDTIRSASASRCVVVAPTHAEGRVVTDAIRDRLKSEGVLLNETTLERLVPRNLTPTQQSEAIRYRVGDVIQFHKHAPAQGRPGLPGAPGATHFCGGERCEVVGVSKDAVTVKRGPNNELARLPLHAPKAFEVFEKAKLAVAVGDRVKVTRTGYIARADGAPAAGRVHRLNNGAIYSVKAIDQKTGHLVLDNGWRVPKGFGHLSHGYAVTSDSAQGRTIERYLVVQTEASAGASSWQQFYTSVTRGTTKITVITDDKERLLRSVARDASRMSGVEFMKLAFDPPSRTREQHRSLGVAGKQLNQADRSKAAGLWVAKETTRRMKQEVNRHLQRERLRQRTREQSRQHRDRTRDSGGGGMNRER